MVKKTVVIAGFPGIGKSTAFNQLKESGLTVLDSDSSKFDKSHFPQNYLTHIEDTFKSGAADAIFVSTHRSVLDGLEERQIPFHLVYPGFDQKYEYLARYKERGSPQPFIDLMDMNWRKFGEDVREVVNAHDFCTPVVLAPRQFLSSVLDEIMNGAYVD